MKLSEWFERQPVTEPAAPGEEREPLPRPEFWLTDYIREVANGTAWRCPWCPEVGGRPKAWGVERAYLDFQLHILSHLGVALIGPPVRRSMMYDWDEDHRAGVWTEGEEYDTPDEADE
jgi:hypothetical protein